MKLHELSPKQGRRHRRIGRSGKRGSYSGRGVKGQKSRSGRRLRPAERDLILRLPKMRGFANLPKSDEGIIFNIKDIVAAFGASVQGKTPVTVNMEVLETAGLLRKAHNKGEVKILGTGEIAFPIAVVGISVSTSAKKKIEKAGGTVAAATK